MTIRWITAFLDHPAGEAEAATGFWTTITGSSLSTRRGERGQFATLVPADGDAYLRVQTTDDHSLGVHLDLHVDSVDTASVAALRLGATLVDRSDDGLCLLRSPAGLPFCLVTHRGESTRPSPIDRPDPTTPHRFDQISIDVPFGEYDGECSFWSELTGWPIHQGSMAEFRVLERPPQLPLRILLQRLGTDDTGDRARAHLDAAVGPAGEAIAAWHRSLGATIVGRGPRWITLTDPSGRPYCLTERDPITGTIS